MTLREATLSPVCPYPNRNVAKYWSLEISWDFAVLGRVMRNKGRFLVIVPSEGARREVSSV
jgi:hypothetical protein